MDCFCTVQDTWSRRQPYTGTQVIWGVNLGMDNLSAAYLEATALAQAFALPEMQQAGVTLEAIEIGNEPDLYLHHGLRRYWNPAEYVKECVCCAHLS